MVDENTIKRIEKILPILNEAQKRIYLASEAEALGHGGITQGLAPHGHKVRTARSDNTIGQEWVVDPGDGDNRDTDNLLDRLGPVGKPAVTIVVACDIFVNGQIISN